jgi:hypothetical protein
VQYWSTPTSLHSYHKQLLQEAEPRSLGCKVSLPQVVESVTLQPCYAQDNSPGNLPQINVLFCMGVKLDLSH